MRQLHNLFKKKFKIWSYGCLRRDIETESLCNYFKANGYVETEHSWLADWTIINTCAYSQEAETDSSNTLREAFKEKRPFSKLLLTGCLSKINKETKNKYKGILILGPKELAKIDSFVNGKVKWADLQEAYQQYSYKEDQKDVAYLKIATGCLGNCSYCVIRKSTGKLISKSTQDIISEYKKIYEKGIRKFVLIAEDVGSYGQDIGTDIVELLSNLLSENEDAVFELFELNPQWLIKYSKRWREFLIKYAERITKVIVPIQSGSDKILASMQRPYKIKNALEELEYLKHNYSHIKLETHFLVGFPGESDEDFECSLQTVNKVHFDKLYVYNYSERQGTAAFNLDNKISEQKRRERIERIRTLSNNVFVDK